MNKLEKIASIVFFVAGVGLFSYGLYKDKPIATSLGLISCSYPAGIVMGEMLEEDDYFYSLK